MKNKLYMSLFERKTTESYKEKHKKRKRLLHPMKDFCNLCVGHRGHCERLCKLNYDKLQVKCAFRWLLHLVETLLLQLLSQNLSNPRQSRHRFVSHWFPNKVPVLLRRGRHPGCKIQIKESNKNRVRVDGADKTILPAAQTHIWV